MRLINNPNSIVLTSCHLIYIINLLEVVALVQKDQPGVAAEEQVVDIERIKQRLDMLDQRFDSIDSMVTAIAERVMKQPITFHVTCPRCAREIEIAIIGTEKPTR